MGRGSGKAGGELSMRSFFSLSKPRPPNFPATPHTGVTEGSIARREALTLERRKLRYWGITGSKVPFQGHFPIIITPAFQEGRQH